MLRFFALAALTMLAVPTALALEAKAPGPDWTLANKKADLILYTRDGEEAREVYAVSEMDFTPREIFEVVVDNENYPEFMPYVKETKILETMSATEMVVWTKLSPPMVSDRDYIIHMKRTLGSKANGGVFKSEWTSAWDREPERKGVVRVKLNEGGWILEPIDGGKRTRVTYQLLTHPGGSIPRWVANKSNTVAIPDLFKAVRERAASQKKK